MNGMFKQDVVCERLKGYYPFYAFNQLYKLKNSVEVDINSNALYVCASKNDTKAAIMITNYEYAEEAQTRKIKLDISGLDLNGTVVAKYYLLDKDHDLELVKEEFINTKDCILYMSAKLFDTILITFEKAEF